MKMMVNIINNCGRAKADFRQMAWNCRAYKDTMHIIMITININTTAAALYVQDGPKKWHTFQAHQMALNSLLCAHVPLRNCSLTQAHQYTYV